MADDRPATDTAPVPIVAPGPSLVARLHVRRQTRIAAPRPPRSSVRIPTILLAAIALTAAGTGLGARVLRLGSERRIAIAQAPASVAARQTAARIADDFAAPPLANVVARLAERWPADLRLRALAAGDDGRLRLTIATADPDATLAALRDAGRLGDPQMTARTPDTIDVAVRLP